MAEQRYTSQDLAQGQTNYADGITHKALAEGYSSSGAVKTEYWQPEYYYTEPPLSGGSTATFSSPGLESSWDPLDESFEHAHAWQQWDQQQVAGPSSQGYAKVDYSSASFAHPDDSSPITNFVPSEMPKVYRHSSSVYPSKGNLLRHTPAPCQVATSDFACQQENLSTTASRSTKPHPREHKRPTSSSKGSGNKVGFASRLKQPTDGTN